MVYAKPEVSNEELVAQCQQGIDVRDQLVRQNTKFIWLMVRNFMNNHDIGAVTMDDLWQEGAIGLLRAAEKFDTSLSPKFLTYAAHWIKQRIGRATMNQSLTVRVPVHQWPHESEAFAQPLSLNKHVKILNDETDELGDFISDPSVNLVTSVITDEWMNELSELIEQYLSRLTPRMQRILVLRYGLNGGSPMTHERLGKKLGVTRERIAKLERTAFQLIRHWYGPAHPEDQKD